jgi:hypothetical protein
LYESTAALIFVSASESGEGWSLLMGAGCGKVLKLRLQNLLMPLGPIGKTPREDPKKRREEFAEFAPIGPTMTLSEVFENNDCICTDGLIKGG